MLTIIDFQDFWWIESLEKYLFDIRNITLNQFIVKYYIKIK